MKIDTDNTEFKNALNLIQYTHQSVFLTGRAGTGKSTFLKYVCEVTKKKHIVLAPTGIAAINVGGTTIHSFFRLPFYPLLPDDPNFSLKGGKLYSFLKYSSAHRKLIQEVELIIIDEISMVRADIIDFIDKILRVYAHNMREPFGGKQMLFVGDVFQLEPVIKNDEREILSHYYPNQYFFSAKVFSQIDLISIELKKMYRQTDKVFISVLDHIRNNQAGAADLQLLNMRYNTSIEENNKDMHITLATRRDTVDFINEKKLEELPGESVILKGEVKGDFPENTLPTLLDLEVKIGAQIIFIKNDPDKRWVNGTIGEISTLDEEDGTLWVVTEDGMEYEVQQEKWSNIRYTYNEKEKKIEEEELGTFIQYPIRLAWAITIHKSQGLTFSNVIIDFSGGVFAGGQAYVALSRCTSLNGIQLCQPITQSDIFIRPEVKNFAARFNDQQAVDKALKQAQADIQYSEAVKAFDEGNFDEALKQFFLAIHSRYDIERPLAKRYIRRKLNIINHLKEQNQNLKTRITEQQKSLEKYAEEYYQMGNECITQAHDAKAALANYNKALEMNPTYVNALVRKGITLYDEKLSDEAVKCLNMAVKLNPKSFKAIYNRGRVRLDMNDFDSAAADFDKAISLKPDHAKAHELFGDTLSRQGKEEEAGIHWAIAQKLREKKQKK
ncbi:MAG: tetratricopeptide repeat protein [Phocaeicola sp.]|uniref:tetratricopeptide repeat protein n=1 Tax=Phocaeicola TaxID=909656 RepID=UPI00234F6E12|nr:tetratricopeptide repeat protein [Phocaeicola oris]MCE2617150.1 AAA family ATPase [Phocaeicola oris]